jgi:hypothetical protein
MSADTQVETFLRELPALLCAPLDEAEAAMGRMLDEVVDFPHYAGAVGGLSLTAGYFAKRAMGDLDADEYIGMEVEGRERTADDYRLNATRAVVARANGDEETEFAITLAMWKHPSDETTAGYLAELFVLARRFFEVYAETQR